MSSLAHKKKVKRRRRAYKKRQGEMRDYAKAHPPACVEPNDGPSRGNYWDR